MKLILLNTTFFIILLTQAHAQELPLLSKNMTPNEIKSFAKIGGAYYPIPEELKALLNEAMESARKVPSKNVILLKPC